MKLNRDVLEIECPLCGDQAFLFDLDDGRFGYQCDSNPTSCTFDVWFTGEEAEWEPTSQST